MKKYALEVSSGTHKQLCGNATPWVGIEKEGGSALLRHTTLMKYIVFRNI